MVYLVFFMTKYQSISGRDHAARFSMLNAQWNELPTAWSASSASKTDPTTSTRCSTLQRSSSALRTADTSGHLRTPNFWPAPANLELLLLVAAPCRPASHTRPLQHLTV